MWRTLTKDEWEYLLFTRRGVGEEISYEVETEEKVIRKTKIVYPIMSFVKATVCGVPGLIIFPDEYIHPEGLEKILNVNEKGAYWDGNIIKPTMWQKMEQVGCVFLPAAGNRIGTDVYYVGTGGCYWASTYGQGNKVEYMSMLNINIAVVSYDIRRYGMSVRLVKDCAPTD